jgi:hypothetical protein
MHKEIKALVGMGMASLLVLMLALETGKRSVMNTIESTARIRLEQRIKAINERKEEKADAIDRVKAYDEYFPKSEDNYIDLYKMKLCDYFPSLKKAGYKDKIKEYKKELIENYPKIIKELDYLIATNPYQNSSVEASRMKKTLAEHYKLLNN